jgi:hypothetical protein
MAAMTEVPTSNLRRMIGSGINLVLCAEDRLIEYIVRGDDDGTVAIESTARLA